MIIRKPVLEDINELERLFTITINHAFVEEGFGDALDEIQSEIKGKMDRVRSYVDSQAQDGFYWIAEVEGRIIGTISFGKVGKHTLSAVDASFPSQGELGSMYILPEYQGSGIARKMIAHMIDSLKEAGIKYASFDSGYELAQKKWQKKFGNPYKIVNDYWGEGVHLMIWLVKIEELI